MSQTRETTIYAQRLILEYNRARKLLRKYFKKTQHSPEDSRRKIKETIANTTRRQSKIIGYTLTASYNAGLIVGNKIVGGTLSAASEGFDLTQVSDTHLNKITKDTIGHIGKYNGALSKQLILEYDTLLSDNRLVNSLYKAGWTPWLDKALEKRGVSAEVIALAKGQTTTNKIISILEQAGIKGGKHPREISKMLLPHIQRYFGQGVIIDNIGKYRRALDVNADGSYKWVQKKITRVYKATPKSYSNLLARSSMIDAHHAGRFLSLEKSGLVDYYISHSILGPRTCARCALMHSNRVSRADGPLYHGNCMCYLKPVWRKDSGLKNKNPEFYENQRDRHFLKENDLREFNKGMPRGEKLKFSSLLPEEAITKTLPSEEVMYGLRKAMLK
jgi:hypothetical protein